MFFISRVFFGNRKQSNSRAAQKKHMFFGNGRPKSNARAHLKHSGLMPPSHQATFPPRSQTIYKSWLNVLRMWSKM